MNKVILIGHVGRDPDIRYLDNGIPVANFSLATSETYKAKDGQKVTTTEWHNIVLWRGLAEVTEKYVKKGSHVMIEGKMKTRNYEKDGVKHYVTEIYGDVMELLGRKEGSGEAATEKVRSQSQKLSDIPVNDFVPTDRGVGKYGQTLEVAAEQQGQEEDDGLPF